MTDFIKLIELVKLENGKVFIMDETGEVQLVVMGIGEYHKLRASGDYLGLSEKVERLTIQAEDLNRKVAEAQMDELLEEPDSTESAAEENRDNLYIEPIETE